MDAISPPPYWYGEDMDDRRGARVMESLRAYRAAEMAMRRRTQDTMAMSENESSFCGSSRGPRRQVRT